MNYHHDGLFPTLLPIPMVQLGGPHPLRRPTTPAGEAEEVQAASRLAPERGPTSSSGHRSSGRWIGVAPLAKSICQGREVQELVEAGSPRPSGPGGYLVSSPVVLLLLRNGRWPMRPVTTGWRPAEGFQVC